jgi:hypothetical protein
MNKTQEKKVILNALTETRAGRLMLEMACWTHDLDKAGWPFLLAGAGVNENWTNNGQMWRYFHKCPSRTRKQPPDQTQAIENWDNPPSWIVEKLKDHIASSDPITDLTLQPFPDLVSKPSLLRLTYIEPARDPSAEPKETFDDTAATLTPGAFGSILLNHGLPAVAHGNSWPWWIVSPGLAGPDGIDSQYFKGSEKDDEKAGHAQNRLPVFVATPFGMETPTLLGDTTNKDQAKNDGDGQFQKIWKIAFDWQKTSPPDIPAVWQKMRDGLRPYLLKALGYTNRPVNDVDLWSHSHGVGAMSKAIAAALALDVKAAEKENKTVLFPLRSPEQNLWQEKITELDSFLLAEGCETEEQLVRQVQTKFKVLSLLIRDYDRLHVGRKVGDILGYHKRRDQLFDTLAEILEKELAVGAEIFRDHAGIHFLLPWCQDSRDAHLDADTLPGMSSGEIRSQDLLEEMIKEVVDFLFAGMESTPDWFSDEMIKRIKDGLGESTRKAGDFETVMHIGPRREIVPNNPADKDNQKRNTQGLLFLKDSTTLNEFMDRQNPKQFDALFSAKNFNKLNVELCPICRRRPVVKKRYSNEHDTPCDACKRRRESRARDWWERLQKQTSGAHAETTIWAAEASDGRSLLNMLTMAFDLTSWFDGSAFDAHQFKNNEQFVPLYPVPARIRRTWEACLDFLNRIREEILGKLESQTSQANRILIRVTMPANPAGGYENIQPGLIESGEETGRDILGDWYLGRSQNKENEFHLVNVSGWYIEKDEKGRMRLARKGSSNPHLEEEELLSRVRPLINIVGLSNGDMEVIYDPDSPFSRYTPMIDILVNSPTRYQVLFPADKTVDVLKTVHDLFLEHFGKVPHQMTFCASNLVFKEKFPFYLALEAADRAVQLELGRAGPRPRRGELSHEQGLSLQLDSNDPAQDYFEQGFAWHSLDKDHRDIYRSAVALRQDDTDSPACNDYIGFTDRDLFKFRREGYTITPDTGFQAESMGGNFYVCCPRLAWAHLNATSERFAEQLSIPLLSLNDWLEAYDSVAFGKIVTTGSDEDVFNCEKCLENMDDKTSRVTRPFAGVSSHSRNGDGRSWTLVKGVGTESSRFRNLLEEIMENHVAWPARLESPAAHFPAHVRLLISNPNTCGKRWREWVCLTEFKQACPLYNSINAYLGRGDIYDNSGKNEIKSRRRKCERILTDIQIPLRRFVCAANRFEQLACNREGRPLAVTFNLLNKICAYRMKDI